MNLTVDLLTIADLHLSSLEIDMRVTYETSTTSNIITVYPVNQTEPKTITVGEIAQALKILAKQIGEGEYASKNG